MPWHLPALLEAQHDDATRLKPDDTMALRTVLTKSVVSISCCSRACQDALGVPAFSTSQEAFAAEDLFNAYRSGDAAAVKALVAKPLFRTIDNQVREPLQVCRRRRGLTSTVDQCSERTFVESQRFPAMLRCICRTRRYTACPLLLCMSSSISPIGASQVARLAKQLPTGDQAALAEQLKSGKDGDAAGEQGTIDPDDLT